MTTLSNANYIVRCTTADGTVTREVHVYGKNKTREDAEREARKSLEQDGVKADGMTLVVMERLVE